MKSYEILIMCISRPLPPTPRSSSNATPAQPQRNSQHAFKPMVICSLNFKLKLLTYDLVLHIINWLIVYTVIIFDIYLLVQA